MHWRRTDAVQEVAALLLTGSDAGERVWAALATRPGLYAALTLVSGEGWAALFAAPMADESEPVLPRIAGATGLYPALPGWWFPVGTALAVPDHVQADLLAGLAAREGVAAPLIAIPRFAGDAGAHVDLYPARDAMRIGDLGRPETAA